MPRLAPIRELVRTRLREFTRQPEVVFWVYGFPVLMALGLALAFRSKPQEEVVVGIVESAGASEARAVLEEAGRVRSEILSSDEGRLRIAGARLDLLVTLEGDALVYTFDPTRPESLFARERVDAILQRGAGREDPLTSSDAILDEPGSRYIDFLLPGLIGMNILGGGVYGIGFVVVDMRVRRLLKRFLATPMRRSEFFSSLLASRMLFLLPEMGFLFTVALVGFGMPFRGDVFSLLVVITTGALCFASLGLFLSTRATKLETISGLINLAVLPMWLLSGVFFSTERFPEIMHPLVKLLPLTAVNDALRGIILHGESLAMLGAELAVIAVWTVACFTISLPLFRWQ